MRGDHREPSLLRERRLIRDTPPVLVACFSEYLTLFHSLHDSLLSILTLLLQDLEILMFFAAFFGETGTQFS